MKHSFRIVFSRTVVAVGTVGGLQVNFADELKSPKQRGVAQFQFDS